MALTDDQLLEVARIKFKKKLGSLETWKDYKLFCSSLTKTTMKAFLKEALQEEVDKIRTENIEREKKASDLEDAKDKI